MVMVTFSFFQFMAAPICGYLSNKFGRRIIIWITLIGSIIAYVLLAYSQTIYGLFFAKAFAGFMAGNISTSQAYLTDITDKKNRAKAMGVFGAAFGLSFMLGPAICGMFAGPEHQNPNVFF